MCPVVIGAGFTIPVIVMVMSLEAVQTEVFLVIAIVWSVVPDPGVIVAEAQFASVQPVVVTRAEVKPFKSNPFVLVPAAVSGIPSFPFALSAIGMVINILPPTGIWLVVVKARVMLPDWVDIAYPFVSTLLVRDVSRLKCVESDMLATV